MTAYANVSRMYGHKKVAQAKEIKTIEVNKILLFFSSLYLYFHVCCSMYLTLAVACMNIKK